MPAWLASAPSRMNSGTASSGKLAVELASSRRLNPTDCPSMSM